jgi:large subunit ribosomal protein L32
MAPLTKRKYAKSRQRERRGHMKSPASSIGTCPQCHSAKLAHHVCLTCGNYDGREAIKIEAPKKKPTT